MTELVLVSLATGGHEDVALLLFINSVGDWCDDVSVEDLIACIRLCWFHWTLVATDSMLVSFAIGGHEGVALLV